MAGRAASVLALLVSLLIAGCEGERETEGAAGAAASSHSISAEAPETEAADAPGDQSAAEAAPARAPEPAPLPVPPELRCEAHRDCRLFTGLCGNPAVSNAEHEEAQRRRIEAQARVASCGIVPLTWELHTPACVEGACTALLGTPEEHRCAEDADCVVTTGPCERPLAIAASAAEAMRERLRDVGDRARCGYGLAPEPGSAAVCDDGLCLLSAPAR